MKRKIKCIECGHKLAGFDSVIEAKKEYKELARITEKNRMGIPNEKWEMLSI